MTEFLEVNFLIYHMRAKLEEVVPACDDATGQFAEET